MKKTLTKLALLGAGVLATSGCIDQWTPQGHALVNNILHTAIKHGVTRAVNPQQPAQTNVYVQGNQQVQEGGWQVQGDWQVQVPAQPERRKTDIPEGIHSYTSLKDKDGDGKIDTFELEKYDKTKFDVQDPGEIMFLFNKGDYEGEIKWYIQEGWESKLPKYPSQTQKGKKGEIQTIIMNKEVLKRNNKYKITTVTDDGKEYAMKIEIDGIKFWNENTPQGIFVYNKWEDKDKDRIKEKDELKGLGKRVFDLSKENMFVLFHYPNQKGNVRFRLYDEKGKLIRETTDYNSGEFVKGRFTGPKSPLNPKGDFMDYLKDSGPGKYRITANAEGVTNEYAINVEVIGNEKSPKVKTPEKVEPKAESSKE